MKNYQAQVEKLRRDATECALIRDLAIDKAKRDRFDRLARHLTALAEQVEMAMLERKMEQKSKAASVGGLRRRPGTTFVVMNRCKRSRPSSSA